MWCRNGHGNQGDVDECPKCERDNVMRAVCEASSDYLLGLKESEFARLNGGTDMLFKRLEDTTEVWHSFLSSEDK